MPQKRTHDAGGLGLVNVIGAVRRITMSDALQLPVLRF